MSLQSKLNLNFNCSLDEILRKLTVFSLYFLFTTFGKTSESFRSHVTLQNGDSCSKRTSSCKYSKWILMFLFLDNVDRVLLQKIHNNLVYVHRKTMAKKKQAAKNPKRYFTVVISSDLQMLQPGYTMLYLDGTQQLFNPLAP